MNENFRQWIEQGAIRFGLSKADTAILLLTILAEDYVTQHKLEVSMANYLEQLAIHNRGRHGSDNLYAKTLRFNMYVELVNRKLAAPLPSKEKSYK